MNPLDNIHDQRDMPKRYNPEKHLDSKLRTRLTLYYFITLALIVIVILHILIDHVQTYWPLLGLGIGAALGAGISRMFHITWDKGAKQAISQMDAFGVLILISYIVFEFYRDEIIERFIQGPAVVATSFAVIAGVMLGRLIGMRGKIREVVTENLKK
jgi:hypothetical protein